MGMQLDIGGPKGNAFYILGLASSLGRKMGMSDEECKLLQDKMTGKLWKELGGRGTDYTHLVRVFKETFPFVTLYAFKDVGIDEELYELRDPYEGDIEL